MEIAISILLGCCVKINDVINVLDTMGIDLSDRTIRNYETWGLIPESTKEWLGRGKGSDVQYSDDTPKQVYAAFHILKFRGVTVEELKYIRTAGLRLVKEKNLVAIIYEQVEVVEEDFIDFLQQVKEKVFFDISSYWMLRIYSDVAWWAWLYIEADKIILGEKHKIPASKRLGKFGTLLNKIFGEDDNTLIK